MALERQQELINLAQEQCNGKIIQWQAVDGKWIDLTTPLLSDTNALKENAVLRIKPKPRTIIINEYANVEDWRIRTKCTIQQAKNLSMRDCIRTSKWVEVIE